jgi:glycosyl transferase family 25
MEGQNRGPEWRKTGGKTNLRVMRIYLINLARRPDRLAAMSAEAGRLGLVLDRVEALDAQAARPGALAHGFAASGPLGPLPDGDKACLVSHRMAWQRFWDSGDPHAVFLEDDVRLSDGAGALLAGGNWVPQGVQVVKLEHYGPDGQRVLLTGIRKLGEDFRIGRMLSRHTGAAAYILSRGAAEILLAQARFNLPVDHLLFNPNNSPLFAALAPWQLLPAIARQQQFVGSQKHIKSDIESTRVGLRRFNAAYVARELVRLGYDLRLLPRQLWALARGATFVRIAAR